MIYGTSHFVSKQAAYRYYRPQGENEKSVNNKIKEKTISIGAPAVKTNQKVFLNYDEGRYFIEETN